MIYSFELDFEKKDNSANWFLGMIILLTTGMQLCWAVTEFDMAVYNKMYSDSIYKIGMIIVCGFYVGAFFGQVVGAIFVIHLKKKLIYVSE